MAEQRGFIFALTFILVFSALLASIPVGLQGQGDTPNNIDPIFPLALSGFSDSEAFIRSNFTTYQYEYDLNEKSWWFFCDDNLITAGSKVLLLGIFWFGAIDNVNFISDGNINRGEVLSFDDIDDDANEGIAKYTMDYVDIGDTAGTAVFYWNTTAYTNSSDAWLDDELYVLHGIGFDSAATANAGSLLVGLLTLSVPDIPEIVQILMLAPIFACVIYLLWYIIKEMIPFV